MSIFSLYPVDGQPRDVRVFVAREVDVYNNPREVAAFEKELRIVAAESTHVILNLSAIHTLDPACIVQLEMLRTVLSETSKKVAIVGLDIESHAVFRVYDLHRNFLWAYTIDEALDYLMKGMPRVIGYPVVRIEEEESAVIVTTCLRLMHANSHFYIFRNVMQEIVTLGKHIILDYSETAWVSTHIGLLDTLPLLKDGKKMAIYGMSATDKHNIRIVNATNAFVWADDRQDALQKLAA